MTELSRTLHVVALAAYAVALAAALLAEEGVVEVGPVDGDVVLDERTGRQRAAHVCPEQFLEVTAVVMEHIRLDDLDAVLRQDPRLIQLRRQVEPRLPAEVGQQRVGPFLLDDPF